MALMIVILVLLIPILAIVLDSKLGQAWADRVRSGSTPDADRLAAERIDYLEAEVDRLSTEVRRLDEESDFLQKLLVDRAAEGKALPPGDSDG